MQGCQVANARSPQVWAEALDAWLQQLAQEIVHEHTSQALTPANVQASLQLLLTKDAGHCESRSDTGLVVRPYVSVTKKHSRGAVSGDAVLTQHLDHDPQNDCISARRSRPRRLSQRPALKVVAKKLSDLWKFVVHLKLAERCGKWAPPDIVILKTFQALLKRSRLAR
ncbi:hypothetical protein WJX77_010275 [Trebouxia sp. C0004]